MARQRWRLAWGCPLMVLTACTTSAPVPEKQDLNVLLLVLDTTRADALSLAGSELAKTPHLDSLAADGVVFSQARSTSAWTIPAHGSLFTGLYPSNHGAHHEHPRLDASVTTLAEVLSSTHQTVGFSENSFIQQGTGYAQGFDRFEDVWRERQGWSEPPETIAKIQDFLATRERDRPFFLFVNLMTPHLPYDPPARHVATFLPEETPAELMSSLRILGDQAAQRYMSGTLELGEATLDLLRRLYLADVAYADEQAGSILDSVRAEGLLDDTLVVVVGDHGENIGDHSLMEHQFSLNETLLRVPWILRLPGAFAPGTRNEAPVQLVDLMPTVLDAVGIAPELTESLDGVSLLGAGPAPTRPVLAEFMRPNMQRRSYQQLDPSFDFSRFDRRIKSFQIGRLKLIAFEDGEMRLFDVVSDPGEANDLADKRPDELALLRRQLEQWTGGGWEPSERGGLTEIDETTERELRSLGYIR